MSITAQLTIHDVVTVFQVGNVSTWERTLNGMHGRASRNMKEWGQEKKWNARAYVKGRRKDQKQGRKSEFLHRRKTVAAVAYVTGAGWRDGAMDRVGMKERGRVRICARPRSISFGRSGVVR